MPSKPVLSDADKKAIRKRLGELCEECWIAHGYKKTSIKNLCDNAGISIGTFYTLYPTKEDLFSETIERIEKRLTEKVLAINRSSQTKEGFEQSRKERNRNLNYFLTELKSNIPNWSFLLKKSMSHILQKQKKP